MPVHQCPHGSSRKNESDPLTQEEWRTLRDLAFKAQGELSFMHGTLDYKLYGLFDTVREYAILRYFNERYEPRQLFPLPAAVDPRSTVGDQPK